MTTDPFMDGLISKQRRVLASEADEATGRLAGIVARWEFGRDVLAKRIGRQLPKGMPADIYTKAGIDQTELFRRTKVAEHYTTREQVLQFCKTSPTWSAIVASVPRKQAKPKATPEPKAASAPPTKAIIAEADRVQAAFDKPEVIAELTRRQAQTYAQARAVRAAEKAQRGADKAQREQDEEDLHFGNVLRQRLVKGDADWQGLTELFEIMADNVHRMQRLLPGLPIPDQMRNRRFSTEIAKLQQGLLDLSDALTTLGAPERAAVDQSGVIDV